MKKMFKMTAVLLGWSSCVAQATKCPLQENNSASPQPQDQEQNEMQNALARFQDLDKIYYL